METENIEYKKTLAALKEGIISIVAILNKHQKGKLLFGVDNYGKKHKQDINEMKNKEIQ